MGKEKLAIIGTGISGLGCGWYLRDRFDITFFEKESRPGGHTYTVEVDEEGKRIPIDTGFMVFNHVTYPLLTALFKELGVETFPTSMSFSVQHVPSGLEYCGSGLNGLFAQRKNIFSLKHIKMLKDIARFNRESVKILDDPKYADVSLSDYIHEHGYSKDMFEKYLIPMSSAVWSTPMDRMLSFPAQTLVRFFYNHGFLGLNTQHQWYTVKGGSKVYRDKILNLFPDSVRLHCGVLKVKRQAGKVEVQTMNGHYDFDKVIVAAHADEALAMLDQPTAEEEALLSPFKFHANSAILHTDAGSMPLIRRTWSSWNYRIETKNGELLASTIYWMNSLQKVSQKKNYFVTINDAGNIAPGQILKEISFTHPLFDTKTAVAQPHLQNLNKKGPVYFAGAWFRYGFHEDGLWSAKILSDQLNALPGS